MALKIMHGTRSQMWTYRGPVNKRLTNQEKDHSRERVHRTPYRETDCGPGNEQPRATLQALEKKMLNQQIRGW